MAAGRSQRFHRAAGSPRKQFLERNGRPLFAWSADPFFKMADLAGVVLVLPEDTQALWPQFEKMLAAQVPVKCVAGGELRGNSVLNGLHALPADCKWVAVHDGARPNVTPALIQTVWERALETGAAVPGLHITDTVKQVVNPGQPGATLKTLDRNGLYTVQTPQFFRFDWLKLAYEEFPPHASDTDDAAIVEKAGHAVALVPGDPENLKITTARDWEKFCATKD